MEAFQWLCSSSVQGPEVGVRESLRVVLGGGGWGGGVGASQPAVLLSHWGALGRTPPPPPAKEHLGVEGMESVKAPRGLRTTVRGCARARCGPGPPLPPAPLSMCTVYTLHFYLQSPSWQNFCRSFKSANHSRSGSVYGFLIFLILNEASLPHPSLQHYQWL